MYVFPPCQVKVLGISGILKPKMKSAIMDGCQCNLSCALQPSLVAFTAAVVVHGIDWRGEERVIKMSGGGRETAHHVGTSQS